MLDHVMILDCEGYVSLDHVYVVFYGLCRVQQHLLVVGRQSSWLTREEQRSHPSSLLLETLMTGYHARWMITPRSSYRRNPE